MSNNITIDLDIFKDICNICEQMDNKDDNLINGCYMCGYKVHQKCLQEYIDKGIITENGICSYCISKYESLPPKYKIENQKLNNIKIFHIIVHIFNILIHGSILIYTLIYYDKKISNYSYIFGLLTLITLNCIYIVINFISILHIYNKLNRLFKYTSMTSTLQYILYITISVVIGVLINNIYIDNKLYKNIYNMIIIPGSLYLALIILVALVLFVILLGIIRIFYLIVRFFRKRSCYDTFPGLYSSEYTRINPNNDIIIYSK